MACRLSKAITAESRKMKSLLLEYNSIVSEDQLSWDDVTDLSSSIWCVSWQDNGLLVYQCQYDLQLLML